MPRRSPLRAAIKTGAAAGVDQERLRLRRAAVLRQVREADAIVEATLTFVAFCGISSAGYFVNDLNDVELDRQHPKKRFRPIAAGELAERTAMAIAPVLAVVAIGLAFGAVNWEVGLMVVGYGVAQIAYSLGLKQIVIVDVMTSPGCSSCGSPPAPSAVDAHASEWLILCTGMLAAFLGFTKRRQEAVSELHEGTRPAPSSSTTRCPSSTRWSRWSPPEP